MAGAPEVLQANLDRAYAFARHVLGGPQRAEEAVQEACLRYLRRPPQRREERAAAAYFMRMVHGAAVDILRDEAARARREEAHMRLTDNTPVRPEQQLAAEELRRAVEEAMASLAQEERAAVCLCCLEDFTQREASEVLEVPQSTVSDRVQRGLEELRRALAARGLAALSLAALGALLGAQGVPAAPAALKAKLGTLAARGTQAGGKTLPVAKGGLSMKIVVGVVLAGALAGGAALLMPRNGGSLNSPPAAAAKGRPVKEHFAFCNTAGYLDGPRRQAMSGVRVHAMDAKGNAYNVNLRSMCALRVARVDGMVETIGGDNRWSPALPLEEGPAAWMPNAGAYGGIGQGVASFVARGLPLEGPDKGCLYVRAGLNSGHPGWIYKVWKNKDQGGRWWFKHVMGGGGAAPPSAAGQSAPALGLKLSPVLSVGEDGRVYVLSDGSLYRYDEEKNELACVLAAADYVDKVDKKDGRSIGGAESIFPAVDGSFFLGYYTRSYPIGLIYRVSADRSKIEKIAQGSKKADRQDGPAMESYWFGGPILHGYYPPDVTFAGAIDDALVRRCKDGRISTLCRDGEWREFAKYMGSEFNMRAEKEIKDDQPIPWGRGWARVDKDTFYQLYWLSTASTAIYRIHPVDFGKPTAGPLVEGK